MTVFLWFGGLSFVFVAWVFASPAIDYRLVALGAVVPSVELVFGGPWALHTLLAPVVAMGLIMMVFMGRRLVQRRWLGLPIGMFMYLVLDFDWTRTTLFWWPLFGWRADAADIPSWRPVPVLVAMELVGLGALVYAVRRYRLDDPATRRLLVREGRLTRAAMGPPPGTC